MVSEDAVKEKLAEIFIPGIMRSIVQQNLVRDVQVNDKKIDIKLASAALNEGAQDWLKTNINESVKQLSGDGEVEVTFVDAIPKEVNDIKSIVAVMSGKGGVGKSLVSGLLSVALARQGKEVGILDADITGPSIPKMFGLSGARPTGSDTGILPVVSKTGISVMSINLVLEHEDDAVIWRGPLIGKAISQFWEEVVWGQLDCLVVDLPPGTADAPLTVLQTLPVSGVVLVFSPQELAAMVVRKAVKMINHMNINILGIVENMSYLILPDSGKKLDIFGQSKGTEMATITGSPLLAQIPIDPELARLCDAGDIEKYTSDEFETLSKNFIEVLTTKINKK
jgi:Mrp family chromosome partitioning ATPase